MSSSSFLQTKHHSLYGPRAIFLPARFRSGSYGTGVFLPRGTVAGPKLNFDEMGVVSPSLGGHFSLQHGTIQTSFDN
ncbi:hypothetical protein AAG906_005787 [Vitis piasezkii]